ncbi:hypothetical protein SAMN05216474_2407 [Lishizhenia tianjinensis]|uniref:Capsule assembly protein Wzi n=1 Tax=Lishizhenia tianjinensis TaxID=477690 RepID=A0A1I7AZ13_9FLAO|nr:hypothetical protein [Lishizhenia tianjinensis]SFT80155.1 hypothetical protein SAMN05216474_2407 [Lishizhenia tianjinensis]
MKQLLSIALILTSVLLHAQKVLLLPTHAFYQQESIFKADNLPLSFPASYHEFSGGPELWKEEQKQRESWWGRKIYNEHLLEFQNEQLYLTLDPIVDVQLGQDRIAPERRLYQNTRGIIIEGEILNQLSFSTSYFENQSVFANYLTDAYAARGEQKLVNGNYITEHAVIPNALRTKPFGDGGFDYGYSSSYVRWRQSKYLTLQLGSSPEFEGYGKRSLLLSDFAPASTQFKVETEFASKWKYSFQVGKALNLWRRQFYTTVEAPFERKARSVHRLSYTPIPDLNITFFESGIWFKEDSVQSKSVPLEYYLPVPALNTAIHGFEDAKVKNVIGLNIGYRWKEKYVLYGQWVTDDVKNMQHGMQLGARAQFNYGKHQLHVLLEYNQTSDELYQAENRRLAYTSFNLPLAYSLGNGTREFLGELNYFYRNIYLSAFATYYKNAGFSNSLNQVFIPKGEEQSTNLYNTLFVSGELGYRFNAQTNLRAFVKASYRIDEQSGINAKIIQVGLQTALRNKHHNY